MLRETILLGVGDWRRAGLGSWWLRGFKGMALRVRGNNQRERRGESE